MNIQFKCKTNKDYVAINSLNVRLESGLTIIIDRKRTEYELTTDGNLDMTWKGCYLWGVNEYFVFDQGDAVFDDDCQDSLVKLLAGSKVWFNYESEADEDYFCNIEGVIINGLSLRLAKKFEPEAFLASLTADEQDKVYRYLWKERVVEDARSVIEEYIFYSLLSKEDVERIADEAADRYVYNGDYDCTLSYWDNIGNLVRDAISEKAREVMAYNG